MEGGGAEPKRVERKKAFESFLGVARIDVLRLVPFALTQPRSVRAVADKIAACLHHEITLLQLGGLGQKCR